MNRARLAVAAIWIAGLVCGSLSESAPVASPPRTHQGFRVLSADFHVHSFPGDGVLPPWVLVAEARRRNLDVIALTNHNHMLSWPIARWIAPRSPDVLILPGEEVTTPRFHMAAIGITHRVGWSESAAAVAAAVHAAGGVAIVAHPESRAAAAVDRTFADVDGVESAPPMRHAGEQARLEVDAAVTLAVTVHPGIAQIGSSDFHYLAPLGLCRTYVFARDATPAAVIDAVRAGRTVACDASGSTYGAADLAAAVGADCRAAAMRRVDLGNNLNRIAVACAWLGALGFTLAGPRRRTVE
jgi:hypothetical protein